MAIEIERKFLVNGNYKALSNKSVSIVQGYLSSVPERAVRVRKNNGKGYITIKGKASLLGALRYEWEKEIPVAEAEDLLKICEPWVIEKTRHLIVVGEHTYEVDEFHGENQGLVIAEIELTSENEKFDKPFWLGEEVTGDERYFNSNLTKIPYTKW